MSDLKFVALPGLPLEIPRGCRIRLVAGGYTFEGVVLSSDADKAFNQETRTWTTIGWNIEMTDDRRGYVYFKWQDAPATITVLS